MYRLKLSEPFPGVVYLHNEDGVWFGPGLGEFRNRSTARRRANQNGYIVARAVVVVK